RASLLLTRDDPLHAQALIESAIRSQTAAGNWRAAALARVVLGQVLAARDDTMGARRELMRAVSELEQRGDPVAAAAALGERAAMEERLTPSLGDSLYRAALDRLGNRIAPEISWRLHAGLAEALRSEHATDGAARELRSALADLEHPSHSLALGERRSAFLADKWE